MAWESEDFEVVAGTTLEVTTGSPTAESFASFAAMTGWEDVTLTQVGAVEGLEWSTSTLSEVSNPHDRVKKAAYTYPQAEFGVTWKPAEPGQVILSDASESTDIISCRVTRPDGTIIYFRAQVMAFADSGGGNTDALTGSLTLLRQSKTFKAP